MIQKKKRTESVLILQWHLEELIKVINKSTSTEQNSKFYFVTRSEAKEMLAISDETLEEVVKLGEVSQKIQIVKGSTSKEDKICYTLDQNTSALNY